MAKNKEVNQTKRVVDFTTQQAALNVYLYEKKNGQGSITYLYEPSIVGVMELIKLGSGAKTDQEAASILIDLLEGGKSVVDVACDLILQSAHLSVVGREGAEGVVKEIRNRVSEGVRQIKEGVFDTQAPVEEVAPQPQVVVVQAPVGGNGQKEEL